MNKPLFKLINKKFIVTIVTSSVFVTSLTIAAIWFYLSNIDRLDIFFDAVSVSSSLGIIFFFILLSLIGFSTVIFISSFVMIFIYSIHEGKFRAFATIPQRFSSICYSNSIFICTIINIGNAAYYFTKYNGYIISTIVFIGVLIFSYTITIRDLFNAKRFFWGNKKRTFNGQRIDETEKLPDDKKLKRWLPLYLLAPGLVQILPMLFFMPQLEFSEGTNNLVELSFLIGFTIVIVTLGILPGSIHLNELRKSNKTTSTITVLICLPAIIIALSFINRSIPNMVINMAMNLSGISDTRTHSYYIETKIYPHSMFNSVLWDTRYYKDIPDRFFVTGNNVFSFGNVKLICPLEIMKIRRESLILTINDPNEHDKKLKLLQDTAMKCVPFDKSEIHTWDLPLSEPIHYEKIKLSTDNSLIKILHAMK